jgi:glucose-6-phosphate isomerase
MTTLSCAAITLDMSRVDPQSTLLQDADIARVNHKIALWMNGNPVNHTENRSAMHMALRASETSPLPTPFVTQTLAERAQQKRFIDGLKADNILHIGIGGSDFAPRLMTDALQFTGTQQRTAHFLSTLTPETIKQTASVLNPQKDFIFLVSKSFGTEETKYLLQTFLSVFDWPLDRIAAFTAAPEKAKEIGILEDNILPMADWVGGRFSAWSSVGLPLAACYGWDHFEDFLAGGEDIDRDFFENKENSIAFKLAVILNNERRLMNRNGLAILPYHYGLKLLAPYLQQLIMESNGKPGDRTAPIVFGQTGTEFQHSFGQFLHQGSDNTLSFFIDVRENDREDWAIEARQRLSINAQAQADTLWQGSPSDDPAKVLPGGRPSLFLIMNGLTPRSLGNLLALFEHATVVDAFISGINPFDQWGVEAGKAMALKRFTNGS